MRKLVSIALLLIFVLSFVAAAMVTPAQAKGDPKCDWICRQTYFWYCCDSGPDGEPGCVIVGRCE
ncbi:MAG: hypothetical protein JSW34_06405 [Candidatus Zixiibacteriota bacterium]|nr:MAG: hypothetical protein JSW34_06405 [candidate division Zixibacteria bacterium]